MTTVEVLEAARVRVEKGWCQGVGSRKMPDGTEQVCLIASTGYGDDVREADRIVAGLIGGFDTLDSAEWNDAPRRTQAEVLDVLDKAIALARSAQ